jgi:hypothetical protein
MLKTSFRNSFRSNALLDPDQLPDVLDSQPLGFFGQTLDVSIWSPQLLLGETIEDP